MESGSGAAWRDEVAEPLAAFGTLVDTARPDDVPLDEAALRLSNVLQPRLDVERELAAIDVLAASVAATDRGALVAELFGPGGFEGDRTTYDDWRNSCLDLVVARRRGIPITLCVLALAVARRRGIRLVGIGLPAHFLLGDHDDGDWFADAFDGGRILDRAGCRELLAERTGGRASWSDDLLRPVPARAIITRMLNNLQAGFAARGDAARLALVAAMRAAVPELAAERPSLPRRLAPFN